MATPDHHHPRRPDTDRRTLQGEENRLKALQLRKAGLSYEVIGRQLHCTKQNAYRLVKSALESTRKQCSEETENLRQLEVERLDAMLASLWTPASRGDHASIDRVVKLMERRARLLGLDAPAKVAPTSPDGEDAYDPLVSVREFDALMERMMQRHDARADALPRPMAGEPPPA